jgi:hypothetical protein
MKEVTRLDIIIRSVSIGQEKSCVVILLRNYQCELWEPFVIKKFACLHQSEEGEEPNDPRNNHECNCALVQISFITRLTLDSMLYTHTKNQYQVYMKVALLFRLNDHVL